MDYGALEYKIQNSDIAEKNKKVLLSDLEKIGIFSMENEKLEEINQRYEILMELESMKNDFLSNKSNLSTISSLKIARLINELENKRQLKISELNNLSKTISDDISLGIRKEIFGISIGDSYRDFVKQSIDFKGIPENIYENDFLKDFYQVFSVNYRIFIEDKYGNVMDFDNEKGLRLTKYELLNIIGETLKEVYGKKGKDYKEIKYTVLFNLNNGEQVIQDIFKPNDMEKSIKNKQLANIKVDKNATDKKEIKVKNKPNNGKSSADKLKISKQIVGKDINASKPNLQKSPIIDRVKILNVGKKLKLEEGKDGFLYADFIEKYGLSESTKKLLGELLKESLVGEKATVRVDLGDGKYTDKTITYTNNKNPKTDELNISQNLEELINNLEKIIVLTLKVESSGGRNVANYNNSGAEGYFQLHTKNGKIGYEKLVGDL
ncbi:MAG: hypothetical protein PHS49_07165, partial [Candidatus Gracilibacteria bacterium]|nr:hypothetical protein [Candidatus Gracilibacteria bacterium]